MSMPFGIIIEGAVALLLALTIGYCVILNDRLKKLHADRDALKQMVADLLQATNMANSAITGLRDAANEADATLRGRLEEADRFAVELANHVSAGRGIMDRIARLTQAVQTSPEQVAVAAPKGAKQQPATTPATAAGTQQALDQLAALQKRRENAA